MMAYIVFGAIGMLTIALLGLLGPGTTLLIIVAVGLIAIGPALAPHPVFLALIAFGIIIWAIAMWGSNDRS